MNKENQALDNCAKGFFVRKKRQLTCGAKILDLSVPQVMGIINIAPDSFCKTSRITSPQHALEVAFAMVEAGAAIVDVGGEPTNPSLNPITSLQQELDRVIPVLEVLGKELPVPISIDTSKPEVMRAAVDLGASFINDIRALRAEGAMQTVANLDVPVCLMHMSYPDGDVSQTDPLAVDAISAIKEFLVARVGACVAAGIVKKNIIIDPGLGHGSFGKNQQQNLMIVKHLDAFLDLELPVLIGASRKTFIGNILNASEEKRVAGSLATAIIAVMNGAAIVRAHDVKETVDAIKVASEILLA